MGLALSGTSLLGCAARSAPELRLAPNELADPLFADSGLLVLGGEAGLYQAFPDRGEDTQDHRIRPSLTYKKPLNSWCAFNLLPVNFEFLLSGSQRDSSGAPLLKSNQLWNVGLAGVSYNADDGWTLQAASSLQVKTIHSPTLYTLVQGEAYTYDVSRFEEGRVDGSLVAGYLCSSRITLHAKGLGRLYKLRPFKRVRQNGLWFADGDHELQVEVGGSLFATPANRLALHSGVDLRNVGNAGGWALYQGLSVIHAF